MHVQILEVIFKPHLFKSVDVEAARVAQLHSEYVGDSKRRCSLVDCHKELGNSKRVVVRPLW